MIGLYFQQIFIYQQLFIIMGNCQQPFENIHDNFSEVSQYNRGEATVIKFQHHSLKRKPIFQHPTRNDTPLDHQLLHTTILHKDIDLVQVQSFDQQPSQNLAPMPSLQLQQLDYDFYHELALSDYVFRDIPVQLQRDYTNLETIEQIDQHGIKYIGQWKNNRLQGNGVLISNTSKYIGQFKNGLKHLHGRQIFKSEVYEGYFQNGRRRGNGIRYTKELTEMGIFDGQLIYGHIEYLNGDKYKGTLQHGIYYGKGLDFSHFKKDQDQFGLNKLTSSQLQEFNTIFKDDYLKLHLKSSLNDIRDDGLKNTVFQALNDIHYEHAEFHQGEIIKARVIYANGNTYEGQLNKKAKHGYGKYTWKDGTSYEGEYLWDEKHGKGTVITNDRKEYRNKSFVNGEMESVVSSLVRHDNQQSELPSEWK